MKRIPVSLGCALVAILMSACGATSEIQTKPTTTSSPEPASTVTTTTAGTVPPKADTKLVGSNGATVSFTTGTTGTLVPRTGASSDTKATSEFGGTLFRLEHSSGVVIYGAVDADIYPLLFARPNWTISRVSADRMWTPGGCAGVPSLVLQDRWVVTEEILDGIPGDVGKQFTHGIRVFDRQTKKFSTLTPVLPQPVDWTELTAAGPDSIEVSLVNSHEPTDTTITPTVRRTINLSTLAFTDRPYTVPPPASPDPWTVSQETANGSFNVSFRSATTGAMLDLTNVVMPVARRITGDRAVVSYANVSPQPSLIADQVGLWTPATNTWDRAFDTQRANTSAPRQPPDNNGLVGFPLWFAGASS